MNSVPFVELLSLQDRLAPMAAQDDALEKAKKEYEKGVAADKKDQLAKKDKKK